MGQNKLMNWYNLLEGNLVISLTEQLHFKKFILQPHYKNKQKYTKGLQKVCGKNGIKVQVNFGAES